MTVLAHGSRSTLARFSPLRPCSARPYFQKAPVREVTEPILLKWSSSFEERFLLFQDITKTLPSLWYTVSCSGWCRATCRRSTSSRDPSVQIAVPCRSLAVLVSRVRVLDDDFAEEVVSGGRQGGCFHWSRRASWCPEGSFQLLSKCVLSSYHTAGLVRAGVSGKLLVLEVAVEMCDG